MVALGARWRRCFAGDTVGDFVKIEGTLDQHGWCPISFALSGSIVGSFVLQLNNDPKHTSRSNLSKKESDGVLSLMT